MKTPFVFFGSSSFSIFVLEAMKAEGLMPSLIVASPDEPQGRHMTITPPVTKNWAEAHGIPVIQPKDLKDLSELSKLEEQQYGVFIVASYGKILPDSLLSIPEHGTLNVHPSLLPKYRGPSPIQSQILADDREVGVSIILLDTDIDHGPLLGQEKVEVTHWPPKESELEALLGTAGGKLLSHLIPPYISHTLKPTPQDHSKATFTKKISKEDGLIDIANDPYTNFLKIQALRGWPGTYFFTERNGIKTRVKIVDAEYKDGTLILKRVIPEGKREMSYEEFERGTK